MTDVMRSRPYIPVGSPLVYAATDEPMTMTRDTETERLCILLAKTDCQGKLLIATPIMLNDRDRKHLQRPVIASHDVTRQD